MRQQTTKLHGALIGIGVLIEKTARKGALVKKGSLLEGAKSANKWYTNISFLKK